MNKILFMVVLISSLMVLANARRRDRGDTIIIGGNGDGSLVMSSGGRNGGDKIIIGHGGDGCCKPECCLKNHHDHLKHHNHWGWW